MPLVQYEGSVLSSKSSGVLDQGKSVTHMLNLAQPGDCMMLTKCEVTIVVMGRYIWGSPDFIIYENINA